MGERFSPSAGLAELELGSSVKGEGVFLVTLSGAILHSSVFADEGIAAGHWPIKVLAGHLVLDDSEQQINLISQIKDVAEDRKSISGMSLDRGDGRLPMFLSIRKSVQDALVLVTARDPEWLAEDDAIRLQQLFGLTRREGELASYLATGKTIAQFAESNFLTSNTVKSHLKQVFKKTGVQSQMRLVAIVLAALR